MTSSFSTILGIKILADAATLLKKDDDAAHYGGVVKDQLERWHATYYNTTDTLVSEKHGRFIHPAQEPDSKKVSPTPSSAEKRRSKAVANSWAAVPERRHLLPTSAVPGRLHIVSSACLFKKQSCAKSHIATAAYSWESCPHDGICTSPDDRLYFVSNCETYPASCGPAQKSCWPDVERGLTIHPVKAAYLKSVKLAENFSCDMPTQGPKNASGVTYGDGSQSVLAYTLFLDAAPTDEIREATLAQLVDAIATTSNHPTTGTVHLFLAVSISTVWNRSRCAGIIGTKWLPEALAKAHRPEVALDMVLQTGAPSWMDQIAHNATTVWENWEWFVGPNMNSHNHPVSTRPLPSFQLLKA